MVGSCSMKSLQYMRQWLLTDYCSIPARRVRFELYSNCIYLCVTVWVWHYVIMSSIMLINCLCCTFERDSSSMCCLWVCFCIYTIPYPFLFLFSNRSPIFLCRVGVHLECQPYANFEITWTLINRLSPTTCACLHAFSFSEKPLIICAFVKLSVPCYMADGFWTCCCCIDRSLLEHMGTPIHRIISIHLERTTYFRQALHFLCRKECCDQRSVK